MHGKSSTKTSSCASISRMNSTYRFPAPHSRNSFSRKSYREYDVTALFWRGRYESINRSAETPRKYRRRRNQPGNLRQQGNLRAGKGAYFREGVALHRSREPGEKDGRLFRLSYGRRVCHFDAGPKRQNPGLSQYLPPPRHEGLSLRRRSYHELLLSLSRLELRSRWRACCRSSLRKVLYAAFPQGRMGLDRGRTACDVAWHHLGDV